MNVFLYCPSAFPASAIPQPLLGASMFLVDQIYRLMARWKFDLKTGLAPLKHAYTRPFIGLKLPAVREYLMKHEVVDCDFMYLAGRKSYGYALRRGFRDCIPVECPDPRLARKIQTHRLRAERRWLPVHCWLRSHLRTLSIDWEQAEPVIAGMRPEDEFRLPIDDYHDITRQTARRIGRDDFTVCSYGRVHTPLTSLPKELRPCVKTSGNRIVGIDLSNSQPLFLGLLALRYSGASERTQRRIRDREFSPAGRVAYSSPDAPLSITMSKKSNEPVKQAFCESSHPPLQDIFEYLRLCESGQLYESLGDDRATAKHQVFLTLYGPRHCQYPAGEQLKTAFPSIGKMVGELKQRDHRRLAWLLQHAESSFFIGQVCQRVMKERPEIPVFTIHDSIYSTEAHLDYLRTVVDSEFGRLGVWPQMKVEGNV